MISPRVSQCLVLLLLMGCEAGALSRGPGGREPVRVEVLSDESRVDVYVGEQFFTSYVFTDTIGVLKKPVLYPIRTAGGVPITRGYPLEVRAGERTDHPHHIGMWLNYGDVNGLDFWNNSDAIPRDRQTGMGTIRHRRVVEAQSGVGQGMLLVEAEWLASDGAPVLGEETEYVFRAERGLRVIDRTTALTAVQGRVEMRDNKEGVLGLRVRRELEMPVDEPLMLTDAEGLPTLVDVMPDGGVSGSYRNSEGVTGYPDVWGKRARWTALSGVVDGDSVTIAILDHPQNVGYPTYWHARDYGLFAANPLGQKEFSGGREELNFSLGAGEQVTFRYRVAVFSREATDDEIEALYAEFESRDEG